MGSFRPLGDFTISVSCDEVAAFEDVIEFCFRGHVRIKCCEGGVYVLAVKVSSS